MESKLKILADTADINLEEAKIALDLADGDVEKALDLVPYVEKCFVIIHGKFICGKNTKLFGLFNMLGNGKEGQLIDFGLAMSYNPEEVNGPLSASPEAFKKVVHEFFQQTETNQVHTFLGGFYENIKAAQVSMIYNFVKEGNNQELKAFFTELVAKIWGGTESVDVEIKTFLLTKVQCEKKGLLDRNVADANESESLNDSSLTIYLETEPIISAVKGKTIDKFEIGEPIPLKITDQREAGRYLGQILSDEMGIATGFLKDFYFKELSERYVATVEFGPKVNGRFMIEPSVRLASYAEIPKKDAEKSKDQNSVNYFDNPIIFLALGMVLMLFLFIIFFR